MYILQINLMFYYKYSIFVGGHSVYVLWRGLGDTFVYVGIKWPHNLVVSPPCLKAGGRFGM